ncbi:MAG: sulfocyanin-like copper-binding protein [Verrucomicrobiaceae bacterium]
MKFASLIFILATASAMAQTTAPVTGHDHSAANPVLSGLKKELIEGITEKDFLKLGDKPQTVKITLVAVFTDANYGMNFNGYAKGGAIYTIPKGWTAEVTYINPSPIPHSAIVIERADTKKLQIPAPYFKGGAIPNHLQGLAYNKAVFSFVADEAGEYALACGFPAHAMNGHWIALDVDEKAKVPTLKLGDGPVKEAK